MAVFRRLFRALIYTSKVGLIAGSLYSLGGWLYHQQIKFRLGDTDQCRQADSRHIKRQIQQFGHSQNSLVPVALGLHRLFTFYGRIWHFRDYEKHCLNVHKNVIQSILKNYQEYGIFKHQLQMQKQITRNDIDPQLLSKVVLVKQLNGQLTSLFAQQLFSLIQKQRLMHTGKIIGVTAQQKYKLGLIFTYLQLGDRIIFRSETRYWANKWLQSQWKKHDYDDTIFKLIFI